MIAVTPSTKDSFPSRPRRFFFLLLRSSSRFSLDRGDRKGLAMNRASINFGIGASVDPVHLIKRFAP